jgi:hypothetical protein
MFTSSDFKAQIEELEGPDDWQMEMADFNASVCPMPSRHY